MNALQRKILCMCMVCLLLLTGCGNQTNDSLSENDTPATQEEMKSTADSMDESEPEYADSLNTDDFSMDTFSMDTDYTEQIQTEVAEIIASSSSLQEELNRIETLAESYADLTRNCMTQLAMNMTSQWQYVVWDTEINRLWSRMSNELDAETKSVVLAKQRQWVALKEQVAKESLAAYADGSIFGLLYNFQLGEFTRNRVYEMASTYAAFLGESFTMPKRNVVGAYLDTQGTNSICSSMYISESMENGYHVYITVFRSFGVEGYIEEALVNDSENLPNELTFVSYDDSLRGTIRYGWDGATFTLSTGEVYEFPFVF